MEKHVAQLVEMGASPAQARAALNKYKDMMRAAERFFEGEFADVKDEDGQDAALIPKSSASSRLEKPRLITPQDDSDAEPGDSDIEEEVDMDDNSDANDYIDYDEDFSHDNTPGHVDPYPGIFFPKDRREEVIEVEEEPESVYVEDCQQRLKIMTQGQWMKGCPEKGEQSYLFGLYSSLTEGSCPCTEKCGYSVKRTKQDFFALYPTFNAYVIHVRNIVRQTCSNCSSVFCLACEEPIKSERDQTGKSVIPKDPLFHCANIQGIILGIGLSMLEQLFAEQVEDVTASGNKRKSATPQDTDIDEHDAPYYMHTNMKGKKAKNGIGYAGVVREDQSGQDEALALQRAKDEKIGTLMREVRVFLPNLNREGGGRTTDYLPHPTALVHLRRRFNYVCSSLLRNDSLSDMSDRSVLYFELFEWLETISNHESLAGMMAMPIMIVSSVKAINGQRVGKGSRKIRERTIIYEGSSGPRELLESLITQAQAASKGLLKTMPLLEESEPEEPSEQQKRDAYPVHDEKGKSREQPSFDSATFPEENLRLYEFCGRIMSTAAAIDRSLQDTKGDDFLERLKASFSTAPPRTAEENDSPDNNVLSEMTDEDLKKAYVEWATQARFEYCDLTVPMSDDVPCNENYIPSFKHAYNPDARLLHNAAMPRRALAIAKELAVLASNMPVAWDSSIFLRVDESRVDVIKALIIGPEGTPYQNGCFCFDIFLGAAYNESPPSVRYMTTNEGRFRFNPNLYADGKVCLSLLGTWSGPGWVSGKSTLLQVLISIQSMILCEEPYCNEPGWENNGGSPVSKAYSANIRRMVVKTAMLGNLRKPPEPFEDVIRTHFRLKARSLMTQLDQWLSLDDGCLIQGEFTRNHNDSSSGELFRHDVAELKRLLQELQTNNTNTGSSQIGDHEH